MFEYIQKLPKTSIATIIGAILVYLQGQWIITTDLATLLSSILVALWLTANTLSGKFNKNGKWE